VERHRRALAAESLKQVLRDVWPNAREDFEQEYTEFFAKWTNIKPQVREVEIDFKGPASANVKFVLDFSATRLSSGDLKTESKNVRWGVIRQKNRWYISDLK
jgi:hypothetical protein